MNTWRAKGSRALQRQYMISLKFFVRPKTLVGMREVWITFKELTPKGYNFGNDSNLVINNCRTEIDFFEPQPKYAKFNLCCPKHHQRIEWSIRSNPLFTKYWHANHQCNHVVAIGMSFR